MKRRRLLSSTAFTYGYVRVSTDKQAKDGVSLRDRMFRTPADAHATADLFKERGVRLYITSLGIDLTSPMGRLVFGIMASVAEMERETIIDRTIEARASQRSRHEYLGGKIPYGWSKVERGARTDGSVLYALEPVPHEAK